MSVTMDNGAHFAINATWSNGRPIVSSWHAWVTPVSGRAEAVGEAAARMRTQWINQVLPILPDNYTLGDVHWVDLDSTTGATGVASGTPMTGGDISAAGTPPHVGVLVTKGFAGSGRATRTGRCFLPGALETLVDENGIVSSGKLAQVVTAMNAFRTGFNAVAPVGNIAACSLVVGHTPSIAVTRTTTVKLPDPDGHMTASPITTFSAGTVTSGIRRRVRG